MGPLTVHVPLAGTVVAQEAVPDPVFAAGMVGPCLAVAPDPVAGREVVSPLAGRVTKLHPHAFIVTVPEGRGVLVHLGIDTVRLGGEGFTLHVAEGDEVEVGQPVATWDPAAVADGGRSPVVPVVALDAAPGSLVPFARVGSAVAAGDVLFRA